MPAEQAHHKEPDARAHAPYGFRDEGVERIEDPGAVLARLVARILDGIGRDEIHKNRAQGICKSRDRSENDKDDDIFVSRKILENIHAAENRAEQNHGIAPAEALGDLIRLRIDGNGGHKGDEDRDGSNWQWRAQRR